MRFFFSATVSVRTPKRAVRDNRPYHWVRLIPLLLLTALPGCRSVDAPARQGDEIVVAGEYFHTGARVVTWKDPGGYNAYTGAVDNFGARRGTSDLDGLRGTIDQLVVHYDSYGLSKLCFEALQRRGLSSHFLIDLDGTIYQTLDLQERAYHATVANNRSIGVEVASIGSFRVGQDAELNAWYGPDDTGRMRVNPPAGPVASGVRTPHFVARPVRAERIRGVINGDDQQQYDYTPEQYAALIRLTAALHRVFPKLRLDYPRDAAGRVMTDKLTDTDYASFQGLLGHFHIQANKVDPGPAFDWEKVIQGARELDRAK